MTQAIGIIPARYASTRLPGKMLRDLCGKPLIQRVYEQVKKSELLMDVIVATDSNDIKQAIEAIGGHAELTSENFASGTDRIATVARKLDSDIIVNIQGDEPFIAPEDIDKATRLVLDNDQAVVGTLMKKIQTVEELQNPNIVKVIVNQNYQAIYFSRHPIPYARDARDDEAWLNCTTYFKHIGIYAYRKPFLLDYANWEPSALEKAEKLEQLRVLEHGFSIHVAETKNEPIGIDTEEDLQAAIKRIQNS